MTAAQRVAKTINIDGVQVLAHFNGEPDAETVDAVRKVARAAALRAAELPQRCHVREEGRHLPCLREPGHEPPHRDGRGREWT